MVAMFDIHELEYCPLMRFSLQPGVFNYVEIPNFIVPVNKIIAIFAY